MKWTAKVDRRIPCRSLLAGCGRVEWRERRQPDERNDPTVDLLAAIVVRSIDDLSIPATTEFDDHLLVHQGAIARDGHLLVPVAVEMPKSIDVTSDFVTHLVAFTAG